MIKPYLECEQTTCTAETLSDCASCEIETKKQNKIVEQMKKREKSNENRKFN